MKAIPIGLLIFFTNSLAGQAFSVLAPNNIDVPGLASNLGPHGMVAGDFNGDGNQDLIFTSSDSTTSTLSVALGNGDGNFQPRKNTVIAGPGFGLVSADFNHDGNLDIAMFTERDPANFSVFLGKGNGSFQQALKIALPSALHDLPFLVAADFNHDGRPDLAAGNFVLLGLGDGTFSYLSLLPGSATVTADFNKDGILDLLTYNSSPRLQFPLAKATEPSGMD